MKLILSLIAFSNLLTTVIATNYMWGELNFGSNINSYCNSNDLSKLDAAVTGAVETCVSQMMAMPFVLDAPPEDRRKLLSCGLTCSSQCFQCMLFCRGWKCTARRLGSPEQVEPSFIEERQLSCSVEMDWQEKQAVSVFEGSCYNHYINQANLSHSCRNFLFDNTDKTFYAQINN